MFAPAEPSRAAVRRNSATVKGEFHAGRPGTRYRRALAQTPASPNRVVTPPSRTLALKPSHNVSEYAVAAPAKSVNMQHFAAEPRATPHLQRAHCMDGSAQMKGGGTQGQNCHAQCDQRSGAMNAGAQNFQQPDGSERAGRELRKHGHYNQWPMRLLRSQAILIDLAHIAGHARW